MDNKIMAFSISRSDKQKALLHGKKGQYIITNLNLRYVQNVDFNDGNTYIFEKCILRNVDLHFHNDSIVFYECTFSGFVNIHNTGIGYDDVIRIELGHVEGLLEGIKIASPQIELYNNCFNVEESMGIDTDECNIVTCNIEAPSIVIDNNGLCNIDNSALYGVKKINYSNTHIDNSYIDEDFAKLVIVSELGKSLTKSKE